MDIPYISADYIVVSEQYQVGSVMSCIRLLFFSTILWQFGVPTKKIDIVSYFLSG